MFLRAFAATLATLIGGSAAAQCSGESYLDQLSDAQTAALTATVDALPYAQGLTWTATKGNDTLTLIGTMHIYDPRLELIRAKAADALGRADIMFAEATAKEEEQLKNLMVTDPGTLFIVDGPTLPELLDDETWTLIADAATARNIPAFMAAKMQPWYLSLILAIPPCAMADMAAGARGLDHMLMEDATAAGIPLQGIEPYTTLFEIFQDSTFDEQVDMLRLSLLNPHIQQQMFASMLDLYFAQDTGRLWELSRIAMENTPGLDPVGGARLFDEVQEALLDKRNRNWIPVITEATIDNDNILIAVGAAHLIGEQGVLQLLENDGWTITQIP